MAYFTDIASEIYGEKRKNVPRGVSVESCMCGNVKITRVQITRRGLNRAEGGYITLEMPQIADTGDKNHEYINALAEEILRLLPKDGIILVAGIGNECVTADSLGPKTAKKIFATRTISQKNELGLREICVFAPGVEAASGISTKEHLRALVDIIHPSALVCIDSLSTREHTHLGTSVQLSTAGLSPKSPRALCRASLGVPVIAIGIPTMMRLIPKGGFEELVVTSKEVDAVISRGAGLLAMALNKAFYPPLSLSDIEIITS